MEPIPQTTKERTFHLLKFFTAVPGEWSNRLIKLLEQIPTDYVLYMQEDHYLKAEPPNLKFMMDIVEQFGLYKLQLSPITRYYTLYGDRFPLFFWEAPKSKYLVCHQPSIWKKDFLLSCLKLGENPWVNEYMGTVRLWARTDEIKGKIAIWPHNWYSHEHITENKAQFV